MNRIAGALCVLGFMSLLSGPASANEFTDVIDAFDWAVGDPFDINLFLGYERYYREATITRETTDVSRSTPNKLDYYNYVNMYNFLQIRHTLNTGLEIGIFRDLAIRLSMPIILKDSRNLSEHADQFWHDANGDGSDDQIMENSVRSHDRSGLDYLAVGLWWGILDQGRDDTKPNWTVYAEGRFGIGAQMRSACASCGDDKVGGISRGYYELNVGLRLSRRYRFLDPYFGFGGIVAWFKRGADMFPAEEKTGMINTMPPLVGTLDFGVEIIPWEQPENFRKLVINVGAGARYHSEGRERTPLFDALGAQPSYWEDQGFIDLDGNGQNSGGREVEALENYEWWGGMTDVENYATFYAQLSVMMQVAKYIKFRVGSTWGYETGHFITKTDVCASGSTSSSSLCANPNMAYRPEIDRTGNRFLQEKTFIWTFFIDATAQF